ncbi:MAG TPA: ATP-binding protein [bacterium]|nr:ATP-binding protein [bacterium]MDX9806366.1 ATP-binding protein [bacterium]HNZ54214.1 ATP-binding protein [bacterium]HOG44497.1 ATP-binding protein [bacterium]HPG35936.1 ATP-binding protein [bacterium]
MYLHRMIEENIVKAIEFFPVIALSGARQTGKSTMLKKILGEKFRYISFDDYTIRKMAKESPSLLLKNFQEDLIIDEIQYAPEILSAIKMCVDSGEKRRFVLTGSQQFNLMKNLKESLAGRVLIMNLYPMSVSEKKGNGKKKHWLTEVLEKGQPPSEKTETTVEPAAELIRGGLPGLLEKPDVFINSYIESYIKTYIERDIPEMYAGVDPLKLATFLKLLAPLSSQLINKSQLGRDIGVSSPTANRWIDWFSAGSIYSMTQPYIGNVIKRLTQMPKGTLFDTALICHLMQISSKETLITHPLLGSIFESRVLHEFKAVISSAMIPADIYHWRTSSGAEVDIVIEKEGKLYAFECKWKSDIRKKDLSGLIAFRETYKDKVRFSAVITPSGETLEIDDSIYRISLF